MRAAVGQDRIRCAGYYVGIFGCILKNFFADELKPDGKAHYYAFDDACTVEECIENSIVYRFSLLNCSSWGNGGLHSGLRNASSSDVAAQITDLLRSNGCRLSLQELRFRRLRGRVARVFDHLPLPSSDSPFGFLLRDGSLADYQG